MGIGILDSEESSGSSSAVSAIALTVRDSADENSNEVTPNLNAPIFCHRNMTSRSMDKTIGADHTLTEVDNDFADPNNTPKGTLSVNQLFSRNNNKIDQLEQQDQSVDETQIKRAAMLGAGTPNATNSMANSAVAGGNIRSPLATVAYNNTQNENKKKQFPNPIAPHAIPTASHASYDTVTGITMQNIQQSPLMVQPSTSQQAAQRKQQQQLYQLQLQKQQQQTMYKKLNSENFFVYRNLIGNNNSPCEWQNYFNKLSDEIILQIFQWLPKKTLIRCSYVCRRFNRCASDETLWTRLDLGGRTLRTGALGDILPRGVVVFRLAQAELTHPVLKPPLLQLEPKFQSKLQYLDLSLVSITKPSLKMLLSCCRQLKKLSLEHVPINDEICNEIAKNTNLEALNLAMCMGLEAWSVRKLMESLKNLISLNISWTDLSVDAITSLVTNVTPNLMRLNAAGCRKTMFDSHLSSLCKRCPQLLELDLSDCTGLTGNAITIICKFKMLEYLSLSRCYLIPASSFVELRALTTLTYLDIFGMLSDSAMEMLERYFPSLGINKFIHSSVARPTVGTRRTSIWGLRTRD